MKIFSTLLLVLMLSLTNVTIAQNLAGEQISQFWTNNAWNSFDKITKTFIQDPDGNCLISETHNYTWDAMSADWVETARSFLTYDVNYHHISTLSEYYSTETMTWLPNYLETKTYNTDGLLDVAILQLDILGVWTNQTRQTFEYNANDAISFFTQELWDEENMVWLASQQTTNTFDGNAHLTETLVELWNSDLLVWVNQFHSINIFDADLLINSIRTTWTTGTNVWVNSSNESYLYNAQINLIHTTVQNWNQSLMIWVNSGQYDFTYSIDGVNMLELVLQLWNGTTWINSYKNIFSDFCIENSVLTFYDISEFELYPNPGSTLTLVIPNLSEAIELNIYDQLGRVVYSSVEKNNAGLQAKLIETSHLASGTYSVKLISNSVVATKSWIKE